MVFLNNSPIQDVRATADCTALTCHRLCQNVDNARQCFSYSPHLVHHQGLWFALFLFFFSLTTAACDPNGLQLCQNGGLGLLDCAGVGLQDVPCTIPESYTAVFVSHSPTE
jgi:hypothetical protein